MEDSIYNRKAWIDSFIYKEPLDFCDEERVNKILSMIPEEVNAVLDVGVGGGYIYRRIKDKGRLRCFGIDISQELVERVKDGDVCVADARGIPFKDNEFDLVLAADLIEHIKDGFFQASVSELIRVSKKYILINCPYKDAIDWPVSICNRCNKEFNIYGHMRRIDMKLIRRIFPRNKFDIIKIEFSGGKRRLRPSLLIYLARRLGRVYSSEGIMCPYCFNSQIVYPPRKLIENIFGRTICAIFFLMDRFIPSIFRDNIEISVLLKKITLAKTR